MSITLNEASEKVGVTRQTLMKAIKTGRVSGQKSDNGEWRIEPVELFRVWHPVTEVQQPLQPDITGSDTPGLQAENRLLREQVAELREERNARSEEHTSELQSTMRMSYADFCLKKKTAPELQTIQTSTLSSVQSKDTTTNMSEHKVKQIMSVRKSTRT